MFQGVEQQPLTAQEPSSLSWDAPVVRSRPAPRILPRPSQYAVRSGFGLKSLLDYSLVVLTLPVTVPIMALAAIAIWAEDSGPVVFVQKRTGRDGRAFRIFKLRTMGVDDVGGDFTLEDDARITRIGGFLRRYRIDELPQIVNILRGEMSVCGPRPEAESLVREYERSIPNYQRRHWVRPGLTGLAQVNQGYAAGVDACTRKLELDLAYLENASLISDLKIILKTIPVIILSKGYR